VVVRLWQFMQQLSPEVGYSFSKLPGAHASLAIPVVKLAHAQRHKPRELRGDSGVGIQHPTAEHQGLARFPWHPGD
jgi:hypothetical protein